MERAGENKPLSEVYKDGKDQKGNVEYSADCKDCYRIQQRLRASTNETKLKGVLEMRDYIIERALQRC